MTFGESFGDVDAEDDSHHATIIAVSGTLLIFISMIAIATMTVSVTDCMILIMVALMT